MKTVKPGVRCQVSENIFYEVLSPFSPDTRTLTPETFFTLIHLPGPRRQPKPQPFETVFDLAGNLFSHPAHKNIFRPKADIGLVCLEFRESKRLKKLNEHTVIFLTVQVAPF